MFGSVLLDVSGVLIWHSFKDVVPSVFDMNLKATDISLNGSQ